MCEYIFKNGKKCEEDTFENSEYCILHMPFPDDKNSDEFKRIAKLKEEKVKEKISKDNFNFEGAKLLNVDFSGITIKGDVNFTNAVILASVSFDGAKIGVNALFDGAKIGVNALFDGAIIGRSALFNGAEIEGDARFDGARIGRDVSFDGAKIRGLALFNGAKIGGLALFQGVEIERSAWFDGAKIGAGAWFQGATIGRSALFDGARIGRDALFNGAEIGGDALFNTLNVEGILSFKDAVFKEPQAEENAYRAARHSYEGFGDRETADRYFLHEMRARQKQKNKVTQFFEWLIADASCSYGTNFFKPLWIWLIAVLVVFPVIYYLGHGIALPNPFFPFFKSVAGNAKSFLSAEYFSVVTATTLGYGDLQPALTPITLFHIQVPIFRLLASIEAIFGTFMWVIFLTVFARKYMR